jgi:RNA polymerase sigma factor (sigma-70 family)
MNFERFTAVDSVKDKKISAKKQKELIKKLQDDTITKEESNILIGSLYNLVIKQARKIFYKFPDRDLEDLIEDGIYNLWLRLPGYDHTRSGPSTYATIVVRSAFLKELDKLKNKTPHLKIKDEETDEFKKVSIPNISLQTFFDESGSSYEPDALGVKDEVLENAENKIFFEEMLLEMFRNICESIVDFNIMNTILDVKKLPSFGGGRRRKALQEVADNHNVKMSYVEKLTKKIQPWIRKHDFIKFVATNQYSAPKLRDVFSHEDISGQYAEENILDVWDVVGN